MKFIFIITAFLISACATGPQNFYRKDIGSGGYSDQMISDDVAIVHFKSGSYTSKLENERMAMRRAAELTIERGYDGFGVEDSRNYENVETSYTPGQTYKHGCYYKTAFDREPTCKTGVTSGSSSTTREPRTELRIKMAKRPIPSGSGWYDARQVLKHVFKPAKPKS